MQPQLFILPVLVFALLVWIWAALLRLSARVMRVSRVGWMYAFQCVGLIVLVSSVAYFGLTAGGVTPSLLFSLVLSCTVYVFVTAWFFRRRGLNADGSPIGWRRGLVLGAVVYLFSMVLFAAVGVSLVYLQSVLPSA